MKTRERTKEIERFILENAAEHPKDLVATTGAKFGISRPAVLRHIQKLAGEERLTIEGKTRDRRYSPKPLAEVDFSLPITQDLKEDVVWRQRIRPLLTDVARNVVDICQYGFTEMVNNVVDHSEGKTLFVHLIYLPHLIELRIMDDGIGVFHKIQAALGLEDEHHAILELAKGKLTTEPEHHTGEGIFFTSRAFDSFVIMSGSLFFSHTKGNDWLLEDRNRRPGTLVDLKISPSSSRQLKEVFDYYAGQEGEFGFTRTIVPVALVRYGDENLVSRSQARRLLARFDRFKEVILDFASVESAGQAFIDEIFRVYRAQNPGVSIAWVNANSEIAKMISYSLGQADTSLQQN